MVDTRFMMNTYRLYTNLGVAEMRMAVNAYIPQARCSLFREFLATDCDWMLCLDHDIIVSDESIAKMMRFTDRYNAISGVYVNTHETGGIKVDLPLLYKYDSEGRFRVLEAVSDHGGIDIDGAGFGLLLLKRDLIERMLEKYGDDPWAWCGHDIHHGARLGEDLTFFLRAKECGLKAVGVFGATAEHLKTRPVTNRDIGVVYA